jgi:hypothetical protein
MCRPIRQPCAAPPPSPTFVRQHLQSHLVQSVMAGITSVGEQRLVVQRSMRLRGLRLDRSLVISLGRSQAVIDAGWHHLAWTCGLGCCLA